MPSSISDYCCVFAFFLDLINNILVSKGSNLYNTVPRKVDGAITQRFG